MAVGFGTVTFDVITTDGSLPTPSREDGTLIWYYGATVKLASRADALALTALQSKITPIPAMSTLDLGTVIVEKGVGVRELTYPEGSTEHTVDAILVSITGTARSHYDGPYLLACRWMLTEVPA